MPDTPEHCMYTLLQWTMPSGMPGGPPQPTIFTIIAADMLLKDAPPFVDGLQDVIDDQNLSILMQAVQNLLADPNHGPTQQHVVAFTSAETSDVVVLQAGAIVLFNRLEKRWPGKTISLIPVPWTLFEKLQSVATQRGLWLTPPPSEN